MTTALIGALVLQLMTASQAAGAGAVYASHLMVDQEVTVSSRITGVVDKIHVDRGSTVTKGQPLCTLELAEFDQDVKQAKEQMDLSKAELDRALTLSKDGVSSQQDLDTKKAAHGVAVAAWEKAKAIRDYAVIRAPFDGIVTEKQARVGEKVIDQLNVPLFKITAFEPLLARIYVAEKELLKIRRGASVEVVPVNFPEARTSGTVEFISPTIDPGSGTFQVIIHVRRDPARSVLRPGLAVEVRVPAAAKP
jgi:membrane fusion protein (multidrug efflux system)